MNMHLLKLKEKLFYTLNLALWMLGLVILMIAAVLLLMGPNVFESYAMAVISLMMFALIIPASAAYLNKVFNNKLTIRVRLILTFVLLISFVLLTSIRDKKLLDSMSPKERAEKIMEREQWKIKREHDKLIREQEKAIERQKEELERQEIERKEQEEQEAKDAKAREKSGLENENRRQKEFYNQLSAPKILYKCKNSYFLKAYGAKFGSYNQLLEKAYADCSSDNLDILEKEEK
jgi:hypothetical protein